MSDPSRLRFTPGAYMTPGQGTASSFGYEPKSLAQASRVGHDIASSRIKDSMIKILPEFGYEPAKREEFLRVFARMLKSTGSVYLVESERREVTAGHDSEQAKPGMGQGFFSPIKERQQAGLVRRGDDPSTRLRGYASNPADEAKLASVRRHVDSPTGEGLQRAPSTQQSLDPANPMAGSTPPAFIPLYGHDEVPSRGEATNAMSSSSYTLTGRNGSAQQESVHPMGDAPAQTAHFLTPDATGPLGERRAHQVHEEPSQATPIQAEDAMSTHSTAASDISQSSSYNRLEREYSNVVPSWQERQRMPSTTADMAAGDENASDPLANQPSSSAQGTARERALEEALHRERLQMQQMLYEAEQREHEREMRTQLMFSTMQHQLEAYHHSATHGGLRGQPVRRDEDDWLVAQRLHADFSERYRYWRKDLQRWETAEETMMRSRVFQYLLKKLPNEITARVAENDVLHIYRNIVTVNSKTINEQEIRLRQAVHASTKAGRPMMVWLDELYDQVEQLEKLNCPVTAATVRTAILRNLKADKRYDLADREISRNAHWSIAEIRSYLQEEAVRHDDLVVSRGYRRRAAKKAKQKKKGNQKAKAALARVSSETTTGETVRPKVRNAQQRAHGSARAKSSTPKAEGPGVDKRRRDLLRNELCPHFLVGKCNKGDACLRNHMSFAEAKKWVESGKGAKGNDKKQQPKKSSDEKNLGECYQFKANGECTYGDTCRFSHAVAKRATWRTIATPDLVSSSSDGDTSSDGELSHVELVPDASKRAKMLRAGRAHVASKPYSPKVGDSIMVDANYPDALLFGMTGVVVGQNMNDPSASRVKLSVEVRGLSDEAKEAASEALTHGIPNTQLVHLPEAAAVRVHRSQKAYAANKQSGKSPYSANIIADSGANVFVSSVAEIFAYLVELSTEEQTVDGISDTPLECTHKGRVTMKLGPYERHIIGLYTPCVERFTLVPLYLFGEGKWSFVGKDQVLQIYYTKSNKTELVCRFPRRVELEPGLDHPKDFISSCGPEKNGTRLHSMFPMPDRVMVWHKSYPEVKLKPKLQVSSPKKYKQTARNGKSVTWNETEAEAEPEDVSLGPAASQAPLPSTIYVWADEADVRSRKTNAILRGIRELEDFHAVSGHRSDPTTALQYAWIYGKTLPVEVRDNQRRCIACDEARIHDEPFRKTALLTIMVGDEYAVDTIDRMPTSHNGYRYLGHASERKTGFGGIFMQPNKSMSAAFIFWLKSVIKLIGRDPLRVAVDKGELNTSDLVAFCEKHGIKLINTIPDCHSNTGIESRHGPLKDMINAMILHGGANDACWEFCAPTANFIRQISIAPAALRKIGYPGDGKERPLTPYEEVVNRGKPIDIRALWDNLNGSVFELVTAYTQSNTGHKARGFRGINLGIIPTEKIVVETYGVNVLRLSDKEIVPCRRVIRHRGVYPWRPVPRPALPPPNRESDVEPADAGDTAPVEPSGGESVEVGVMDTATPPKVKEAPTKAQTPPGGAKLPRRSRASKYPPGTEVMTTGGPAIVIERCTDGDYNLRWASTAEPQDVFSVKPNDFWLVREWPDYIYAPGGERIDPPEGHKAQKKTRPKPMRREPELKHGPEADLPPQPPVDAPAGRTRSHARPSAKHARVFDDAYPNGVRVMEYPEEPLQPAAIEAWKAMKGKAQMPIVPPDFPESPTTAELRGMDAADIIKILPRHYHQTLRSPLRRACAEGEYRELQDCMNRNVWDHPVRVKPNMIVIGLMWVYAVKDSKDSEQSGRFDRIRSRITLMGNQERNHLPALDAYAPVAQMVTARILLASHIHLADIILRKLDVKNAYINEYMRRVVYCRMPPGYTWVNIDGKQWTLRPLSIGEKADSTWCLPLVKALYGGMECGRIFWEAWVDWHLRNEFQIIHEERCYLCKRHPSNGSFIKLVYHVDDNLIVARGQEYYDDYLVLVRQKFDVEEGPLLEHLGVYYHFDRESTRLTMSQSVQVRKVLKVFGMENCNSPKGCTPTLSGPIPTIEDELIPNEEPFDMMGFVGHMTWLYQCTRPDIGMVLKILSRATQRFGKRHVQFAKHLMRYLQGTKNQVLEYVGGYPLYYQIFTDASHASCPETRRSILSIVVKLGGMTVYWKNTFSKIVSHSSCESELFALDIGATTGQCLRWLLQAMGGPIQGTVQVFVDNQGTINISTNPVQSGRNLHVHARYFYVRDLVYGEDYVIDYLPTGKQVADIGCTYKGAANFHELIKYLINTARVVHDEHKMPQWECLSV